ncbi:hypothetical protein AHAS_Ahas12G0244900 [Arachis hypogaea]
MYTFKSIHVNIQNATALVEAGASLGQLYYKVARNSHVHGVPGGICPSVGTGGHFGGGGYGNLMRKYGLAVDNIIDAKIVDVNGNILDRKSMGEDLFWAIRGGGGASFGVIVSWTMKLVEVPPVVTVFRLNRTLEQGGSDLVYKWQHVAPKLHRDIFIRLQIEVRQKTVRVSFVCEFLGRVDRLLSLMKKSFPELGLTKSDCFEMPWVNSTLFFAEWPMGTVAEALLYEPKRPADSYFKAKSDYVQKVISKEGLQSVWKQFIESEVMIMEWNPYGGRMWDIPASATPFPHRSGNLFQIQYMITWYQDGEDTINHNLNILRSMYKVMTPFVSKSPRQAYLNYRDRDIGANPSNGTTNVDAARIYGAKFFRENFDKLVQCQCHSVTEALYHLSHCGSLLSPPVSLIISRVAFKLLVVLSVPISLTVSGLALSRSAFLLSSSPATETIGPVADRRICRYHLLGSTLGVSFLLAVSFFSAVNLLCATRSWSHPT